MKNTLTYLTSRTNNKSIMNLDIMKYLTTADYFEITITDVYKFRIDKIAKDYIGDKHYYFFIMWINDIFSLDDIDVGKVIKIPKLSFIKKVRRRMKIERGV